MLSNLFSSLFKSFFIPRVRFTSSFYCLIFFFFVILLSYSWRMWDTKKHKFHVKISNIKKMGKGHKKMFLSLLSLCVFGDLFLLIYDNAYVMCQTQFAQHHFPRALAVIHCYDVRVFYFFLFTIHKSNLPQLCWNRICRRWVWVIIINQLTYWSNNWTRKVKKKYKVKQKEEKKKYDTLWKACMQSKPQSTRHSITL